MTVKEHSYEGVTLDFREKAPGSDIAVTAKLYMQNRVVEEVQRSFTFSFVEKKNAVNVYDFEDFKTVYKNYYTFDYVMQDNIVAENVTTDFLYDEDLHQHSRYKADNLDKRSGNVLTNMIGSIYGNGFMYDAAKVKVPENDQGALSYRFQSMYLKLTEMYAREHNGVKHSTAAELKEYMKEKGVDEITIYNVRFRGAETLEEAEGTLGVICYMMRVCSAVSICCDWIKGYILASQFFVDLTHLGVQFFLCQSLYYPGNDPLHGDIVDSGGLSHQFLLFFIFDHTDIVNDRRTVYKLAASAQFLQTDQEFRRPGFVDSHNLIFVHISA